jgi:hypothetical protein
MIYFGYPLDIRGWKTKPEPDWFRGPEPENRGWEIIPEPKPAKPKTRGYPTRNRPAAILKPPIWASVCLPTWLVARHQPPATTNNPLKQQLQQGNGKEN